MRIGEALQLALSDLYLDKDPVQVNIRGEHTKTGNPRFAFISSEAKEVVQEWLKVRASYLKAASRKSHLYKKQEDDSRLFPFEHPTARQMWNNALKKTRNGERDASTNRYKIHPHVLRKFFRTALGAILPVDIVEALMGHEGYLTEVYRRNTIEDFARALGTTYVIDKERLVIYAEANNRIIFF